MVRGATNLGVSKETDDAPALRNLSERYGELTAFDGFSPIEDRDTGLLSLFLVAPVSPGGTGLSWWHWSLLVALVSPGGTGLSREQRAGQARGVDRRLAGAGRPGGFRPSSRPWASGWPRSCTGSSPSGPSPRRSQSRSVSCPEFSFRLRSYRFFAHGGTCESNDLQGRPVPPGPARGARAPGGLFARPC